MATYRVGTKMNPKIDVLMDTNVIEDNTADSLRVVFTNEKDIVGDYEAGGKIIKGDNLKEVSMSNTTMGGIKEDLNKIISKKVELQAELDNLEQQKIATEKLILDVAPIVDSAITTAIEEGAVDNRTK